MASPRSPRGGRDPGRSGGDQRRGRPGGPAGARGRDQSRRRSSTGSGRPGRERDGGTRSPDDTARGGRRQAGDKRRQAGDGAEMRGPRRWGGVARRGAGREGGTGASEAWQAAAREATPPTRWQPEEWIDEGELRDEAQGAVGRSRSAPSRPRAGKRGAEAAADGGRAGPSRRGQAPPDGSTRSDGTPGDAASGGVDAEVRRAVAPNRVARFESRLKDASTAFRRERYEEARRILRQLAEQAPGASSVRELYGLTLYRLGRWAQAKRELEAFRTQTGSTEQHPVLADCYRALGQYAEVEELWDELREASPSAELVAEGRIVAAGALADQGRLEDAIRLLEAAAKPTRRPKLHHLRLAYASADLYERAGDLPRARELFGLVATNEPDFVDVQARLRALR